MKKSFLMALAALLLTSILPLYTWAIPAFPGAEGWGSETPGGRGGVVVKVTNLNDSGPGSLRAAMETGPNPLAVGAQPRYVVFDVGGSIALFSPIVLASEAGSNITLAGQTAPGGIELRNYGFKITDGAHDIVLRHIRVRPGIPATPCSPADGEWTKQVYGVEIISGPLEPPLTTTVGARVHDIVLDHLSLEYAPSRNLVVWNWVENVTVQWNTISAASLTGRQDPTSQACIAGTAGGLQAFVDDPVADKATIPAKISIHHNLFAHNPIDNPNILIKKADVRNNVIYNWLDNASSTFGDNIGVAPNRPFNMPANLVGNVYKKGPNSNPDQLTVGWFYTPLGLKKTKIFVQANRGPNCPGGCLTSDWDIGFLVNLSPNPSVLAAEVDYRKPVAVIVPAVTTDTLVADGAALVKKVANRSGAGGGLGKKDAIDKAISADAKNGGGALGNAPVRSGASVPNTALPPPDGNGNGIDDNWEAANGIVDPNPNADQNGDGYTNIEAYLNNIAP